MTVFIISALIVLAVVGAVRALMTDGYRRVPNAPIRRPEGKGYPR